MGENNNLARYIEYKTNWSEMSQLPDEHLATMSILQCAASETNALRKIYLCQIHAATGEKALDSAINIHRFMILRIWSSRLFEAIQFLKVGNRKYFIGDNLLEELAQAALPKLEEICAGGGYETARDIRNEAANHYSFKAAKKNLKHVSGSMGCNMYFAGKNGNEFFPMGEGVIFHAKLNRRWTNLNKTKSNGRFANWLDWNAKANEWLSVTHAHFAKQLVFEKLQQKAVKKTYSVSDQYATEWKGNLTPIYFQGESP